MIERLDDIAVASSSPGGGGVHGSYAPSMATTATGQFVKRIEYWWSGDETMAFVEIGNGTGVVVDHSLLSSSAQEGLQLVFVWETEDDKEWEWTYLDARPMPFPPGTTTDLAFLQNLRKSSKGGKKLKLKGVAPAAAFSSPKKSSDDIGSESGDDYWARYDDGSSQASPGAGRGGNSRLSWRSTGDDAYWSRYGHESPAASPGVRQEVAPPMPPAFQNAVEKHSEGNILEPMGVDDADSEDRTESLAMHLQPDLHSSSDFAQGLALDLNSPPPMDPTVFHPYSQVHPEQAQHSSPPHKPWNVENDNIEGYMQEHGADTWSGGKRVINGLQLGFSEPQSRDEGSVDEEFALGEHAEAEALNDLAAMDAIRGVFALWRIARNGGTPRKAHSEEMDRNAFLTLVERSIAGKGR